MYQLASSKYMDKLICKILQKLYNHGWEHNSSNHLLSLYVSKDLEILDVSKLPGVSNPGAIMDFYTWMSTEKLLNMTCDW